ncbi:hypothetical protein [Streptomyces taklimakanensis]|uniref:hypothetical protein n=1 Tax=Streptomyces taklimakanensis TaxID=2569853 RepID=UPI001391711D|nr:hypothetical protein [Streptomyces taklimakanensis]
MPKGTEGFVELVRRLVVRERRRDRPLPLLRITGDGAEAVLDVLGGRLRGARNPVPYARVPVRDAAGRRTGPDLPDLLDLLTGLCDALPGQRFGADRLRFRHYGLLRWLLHQDIAGRHVDDVPTELVRRLREHRRPRGEAAAEPSPFATLGTVHHVLWFLAQRVIPAMLFRAALSERIPGIGRTYR